MNLNQKQEKTARRQIVAILSDGPAEVPLEVIRMLHQGSFNGASSHNHLDGLIVAIKNATGRTEMEAKAFISRHLIDDHRIFREGIKSPQILIQSIHTGDIIAHNYGQKGNQFAELLHRYCAEALQNIEKSKPKRRPMIDGALVSARISVMHDEHNDTHDK